MTCICTALEHPPHGPTPSTVSTKSQSQLCSPHPSHWHLLELYVYFDLLKTAFTQKPGFSPTTIRTLFPADSSSLPAPGFVQHGKGPPYVCVNTSACRSIHTPVSSSSLATIGGMHAIEGSILAGTDWWKGPFQTLAVVNSGDPWCRATLSSRNRMSHSCNLKHL